MIARSARIHSIRVLEAMATRSSRLDAEREQPGRQLEDLVLGLRPAQRDPAIALDVAKCLLGREAADPAAAASRPPKPAALPAMLSRSHPKGS